MEGVHSLIKYVIIYIASFLVYFPPPIPNRSLRERFVRVRPPQATVAVLYFHGNAGIATEAHWLAFACEQRGLAFYAAEYPGYGTTQRLPRTEAELLRAAEQALDWVYEDGIQEVILWGRSLGSAPAVHLASTRSVRGLVVHAGFASIFTVVSSVLGGWMRVLDLDMFPNVDKMPRVQCPVFFVHPSNDTLIRPQTNLRLNQQAVSPGVPQRTLIIPGGHNSCPSEREVLDILEWIMTPRAESTTTQ